MEQNINILSGAKRLRNVKFSPIRTIIDKAANLRSKGYDVIALSAGEPNFNTPQDIKDATIAAINQNFTHYGSNRGLLKLRKLISADFFKETSVSYNPETEIVITCGGAEAINNAILSVVDEGDEVILFTPAFVSYENLVRLCGGIVVDIPLKKEDHFQINIENVKRSVTEKTKLIIINNPCNPTGVVYSKEVLSALSQIAVENNFLVFSDEMYSKLTYEGEKFYSIASFPGMKERSIIINGFSKTYAMTGWRLGYILADQILLSNIMKTHQYSTTCATTFIQEGLANSMHSEHTINEVDFMISEFAKRRILLLEGLDRIPKFSYVKPYGAFYIMVDVSKTGLTGEEFATRLIDEKYVATVPAVGLGKECIDFIRVSFAASDDSIKEGLKRIEEFVNSL